jgi:hypothetical protein
MFCDTVAELQQRLTFVMRRLAQRGGAFSAGEINSDDVHEMPEDLLRCGMNACLGRMFLDGCTSISGEIGRTSSAAFL